MIPAELQADVSQHPLDIFPCFSQTAQVIDRELEHSAHLSRKGTNTTGYQQHNQEVEQPEPGRFHGRVPQTVGVGMFLVTVQEEVISA